MKITNILMLCLLFGPVITACGPTEEDRERAEQEAEEGRDELIRDLERQETERKELEVRAREMLEEGKDLTVEIREFSNTLADKSSEELERMGETIREHRNRLKKHSEELTEVREKLKEAGRRKHAELIESIEAFGEEAGNVLKSLKEFSGDKDQKEGGSI